MQEMILNQLNHPDSGVRTETLVCFLLKSMLDSGKKWSEIERNLAEDCREGLMDQLLLEAGISKTLLNTGEMLNIVTRNPHIAVLESLSSVFGSLEALQTSFCVIIMPGFRIYFLYSFLIILLFFRGYQELSARRPERGGYLREGGGDHHQRRPQSG